MLLTVTSLREVGKRKISDRWWMLILGMCTYGTFYTGRQNFGIAAAALRSDLHLTAVQIGTISGSMLAAYSLGSIVSGYLADRIDARWIVCFGASLSILLNWIASFAIGYHQVLLPWALNGLAQALGWAPCSRLVTSWWPQSKRASIFGIVLFVAGLASFATYVLSLSSLDMFGWRYVFRLPVLSLLPSILLFLIFARQGNEHSEEGHIVDQGKQTIRGNALWRHYRPLIKNFRFLLFCGSIGCESLARYGLLIWVPIHLLGHDWRSNGEGRWLMLFLPVGMAFGALSTGFVSDRLFRHNRVYAIIAQMLFGAVLVGSLYFVPKSNVALSCGLLLLAGFTVYGPQAAYWTVGTEIGGAERPSTALGIMDSCAYVFAALGETCIGWIVDKSGTTASIFPTIACACLLAAIMAVPTLKRTERIA